MSIKRVKLNYKPIAKRKNNEIAFAISYSHIDALNKSIHNKTMRNQTEQNNSYYEAKNFHVGNYYSEKAMSLVRKK